MKTIKKQAKEIKLRNKTLHTRLYGLPCVCLQVTEICVFKAEIHQDLFIFG